MSVADCESFLLGESPVAQSESVGGQNKGVRGLDADPRP